MRQFYLRFSSRSSLLKHSLLRFLVARSYHLPLALQGPNSSSRTVEDSRTEHILPLASDRALREQYVNHYGDCRLGLLLENLDLMAGAVGYRHALGVDVRVAFFGTERQRHGLTLSHPDKGPVTIVTASADRIDRLGGIDVSQDLKLVDVAGELAYVGRSSMEIAIDLIGMESNKKLLSAQVTMVARDEYNKAYKVPALELKNDKEKQRRDAFLQRLNLRKKRSAESLLQSPPTPEERLVIHDLIYKERKKMEQMDQIVFERKYANMDTTDRQSTVIMYPQKQNVHGKVFGGYLMRIAFEQAWATAYLFSDQRPQLVTIFEQTFLAPVEIGSICEFNSVITYTTPEMVQVEVQTVVLNPHRLVTNTFYFDFKFDSPIRRQIMPRLYDEAMKYIESKRRHESPRLELV